jgi:hypothetical protein
MTRQFKAGDTLRTSFAGPLRDQVFRLVKPVPKLGSHAGGHWWVSFLVGSGNETAIQVDSCPRVSRTALKKMKLKAP